MPGRVRPRLPLSSLPLSPSRMAARRRPLMGPESPLPTRTAGEPSPAPALPPESVPAPLRWPIPLPLRA